MKRWQPLLTLVLVFCVALAGAVGRSPTLHVSVEHGGHGSAHAHIGADGVAHSHQDARRPGSGVFRMAAPPAASPPALRLFLVEPEPLTIFGLQPQDIIRALGRVIAKAIGPLPATPLPAGGGHTHHSLAQMLISGAVEGAVIAPLLVFAPERFTFVSLLPNSRPASADWYPPTASRGPPASC